MLRDIVPTDVEFRIVAEHSEAATRFDATQLPVVLMNLVSFGALAYGYFAFVNLNFTSLRVRFLRELVRFDHPVTPTELLGVFDAREALGLRRQDIDLEQREADRAAVMMVRALREVYAVVHPTYLVSAGLPELFPGREEPAFH